MKERDKRVVRTVVGVLLLTAVLLLTFATFHHVLPRMRAMKSKPTPTPTPEPTPVSAEETPPPEETPESTPEPTPDPRSEWQIRFAEHFTDEVVITERSYTSPDVSITITEHNEPLNGKKCVYYVADIYVGSVENFGACLAGDQYLLYYKEPIEQIAESHNAILAINGDFYSYQLWEEGSVTVRNGEVYRKGIYSPTDICVLYNDGTMATYSKGEYSIDEVLEQGVRHIWHFGPKLLNSEGEVNYNFNISQAVSYTNPRTAVGYFEPGHYCFVVVDGRQDADWSSGMLMEELAQTMKDLGCACAYNLDGGGSTVMYFNGQKVNRQSNGGDRDCGDALFIAELVG